MPQHKSYVICIGGFQQGIGERSGLFRLWMKLSKLRGENTSVDLYKWDTRWSDVAEQIWLASEDWEDPRIVVAAYSYGGGWGFLRLAKELGRRGLSIDSVILSDAVYRSRWIIGKWLAFTDIPTIWVPENVRHVQWFFQRTDRPRGHQVKPIGEGTVVDPGVQIRASHLYMDDQQAFHKLAIQIAERAVSDAAIDSASV